MTLGLRSSRPCQEKHAISEQLGPGLLGKGMVDMAGQDLVNYKYPISAVWRGFFICVVLLSERRIFEKFDGKTATTRGKKENDYERIKSRDAHNVKVERQIKK